MEYLHLDHKFQPFGSSIPFKAFTFSGGEPHIKIEKEMVVDHVMITTRICSFNDMGMLLLAADALKRMGVKTLEVFIPYFPAARQDRLMVKGEPLSVKVMTELINSVGFATVIIADPHSEVTPALLNNVKVINYHDFVKRALEEVDVDLENVALVSPDGGALKKIYGLSKAFGGIEVVEAGKIRDVRTGTLTDFKVYAENLSGKNCVVVDDICDGGGTFIGLAKALKEMGAGQLSLVVTHGIFSKGAKELAKYYDQIVCSNSFSDLNLEEVKQINIVENE